MNRLLRETIEEKEYLTVELDDLVVHKIEIRKKILFQLVHFQLKSVLDLEIFKVPGHHENFVHIKMKHPDGIRALLDNSSVDRFRNMDIFNCFQPIIELGKLVGCSLLLVHLSQ